MTALLPGLIFIIWLCVVIFMISLVVRLVRAVERIADGLERPGLSSLPTGPVDDRG